MCSRTFIHFSLFFSGEQGFRFGVSVLLYCEMYLGRLDSAGREKGKTAGWEVIGQYIYIYTTG